MTARLLRALALLIVIGAVIDPAFTRSRPVMPVVEVTVAPGAEALGEQVSAALAPSFVLVAPPVALPAARVMVGDLPHRGSTSAVASAAAAVPVPAFVVTADPTTARADIGTLQAPTTAPLHARIPVDVTVRSTALDGGVDVELTVDGVAVDRVTAAAGAAEESVPVSLSFMPSHTGPHHVRVTAYPRGATVAAQRWADTLVTVTNEPWKVLVYDPRPSWSSTFVRRALDGDGRFDIATRVALAPQAEVTSSAASPGLDTVDALLDFDVVVVGASEALAANEVDVLADFMRRRGGSVVLLADFDPGAGAAAQLTGAAAWQESLSVAPAVLVSQAGEPWLRASEVASPDPLPAGARVLARTEAVAGGVPVVWQRPAGAGRLVVSGALDAWRFRAAADARFGAFWRAVIADAAAAAPAAINLSAQPRVGRPGDIVRLSADLRAIVAATDSSAEASVSGRLEGGETVVPMRLWPGTKGRVSGELMLPEEPGAYRLVVETTAGARATADLLVVSDAAAAAAPDAALLEIWAAAHGGEVVPEGRLADLGEVLHEVVEPVSSIFVWHPMRSAWWVLPFALALGGEWWIRRRRGQR